MLRSRLLMSALLIPLLAAIFFLDMQTGQSAALFGPLCMALSALAAGELVQIVRNRVPTLTKLDVQLACVTVVLIGWGMHAGPASPRRFITIGSSQWQSGGGQLLQNFLTGIVGPRQGQSLISLVDGGTTTIAAGVAGMFVLLCGLAWFVEAMIRYERGRLTPGQVVPHMSAKLLIVLYAGGLIAATSQLRWYGINSGAGYRLLAGVLVAVKAGDIGAYFIGRQFGKEHPLKRLSPGKTGAGFVGAVITGSVGFTLWMLLTHPQRLNLLPLKEGTLLAVQLLLVGLILAMGGICGDLAESLMKRECGVKDSSNLLPGFGGVLDVLDSVIFVGSALVIVSTLVAGMGTIAAS